MVRKRYRLSSEDRIRYAGILLLKYMKEEQVRFPILSKGEDVCLDPILHRLRENGFVEIIDGEYRLTGHGEKEVEYFISSYFDFLKEFEVYQSVDLDAGEFAWSSYFDFENEEEFRDFLNEERWEDVRFAALEYQNEKKMFNRKVQNPIKIVFMSYLNENRFDFKQPGWRSDLLSGKIWDEILMTCNSMVQWQDLGDEDVIQDIIKQGSQLTKELS